MQNIEKNMKKNSILAFMIAYSPALFAAQAPQPEDPHCSDNYAAIHQSFITSLYPISDAISQHQNHTITTGDALTTISKALYSAASYWRFEKVDNLLAASQRYATAAQNVMAHPALATALLKTARNAVHATLPDNA